MEQSTQDTWGNTSSPEVAWGDKRLDKRSNRTRITNIWCCEKNWYVRCQSYRPPHQHETAHPIQSPLVQISCCWRHGQTLWENFRALCHALLESQQSLASHEASKSSTSIVYTCSRRIKEVDRQIMNVSRSSKNDEGPRIGTRETMNNGGINSNTYEEKQMMVMNTMDTTVLTYQNGPFVQISMQPTEMVALLWFPESSSCQTSAKCRSQ